MKRTAILRGERDELLGRCEIPETTMLIAFGEAIFLRSESVMRLKGGGIGAIFDFVEPTVRTRLNPL